MVTTKTNWSGQNVIHCGRKSQFGPDQFILVVTVSFWLWPNHYGQVQINLVKSKSIWSDQNHLDRPKLFWSHRRTRHYAFVKHYNFCSPHGIVFAKIKSNFLAILSGFSIFHGWRELKKPVFVICLHFMMSSFVDSTNQIKFLGIFIRFSHFS